MADLLSLGSSAASVAVQPESPFAWAGLAKSFFSAFGGSGSTPSVLQGLRVSGSASANGFQLGSVTAFDQLGNTWNADPASSDKRWFSEVGNTLWGNYYQSSASKNDIVSTLGGASVPVTVSVPNIPGDDGQQILQSMAHAVAGFIGSGVQKLKMSDANGSNDISAPTVGAGTTVPATPSGTNVVPDSGATVGGGTGSGGSSTVAPKITVPAAVAGVPIEYIALALIAYYLLHKHA